MTLHCVLIIFFIAYCLRGVVSLKNGENVGNVQLLNTQLIQGNFDVDLNIPDFEMEALENLYESTNGSFWEWKVGEGSHWNFTGYHNPCLEHWQGLFCGDFGGDYHVNEIDLSDYNLNGRLPDSLGNLTHMEYFDVDTNYITGVFPQTSYNWQFCYALFLEHNLLSGTIPIQGFISMPALQYLRLDSNNFNGTLSNEIGQFPSLLEFTMTSNRISGTIPEEIGNISTLQYLELSLNNFTGCFPSSLHNLTNILVLEMDFNRLSGSIPGPFNKWTVIQELNLAHNNFTGIIHPGICNCSTMLLLEMNNNALSGSLPACLDQMTFLRHLELSYNNLTGSIPESIYSLRNITNLSIAYNKLSGSLSPRLGQLATLQYIALSFNLLTSNLPVEWSSLSVLHEIYLQGNLLTGPILMIPNVMNLTALRVVQFANNLLSGSLPEQLYNVSTLFELFLVDNQLTGTVSREVSGLQSLFEMSLSYNHFSGSLPSYLNTLSRLDGVFLDSNLFTGGISCGYNDAGVFVNVTSLAEFVASTNFLSGTISDEFSQCMRLTGLMLGHNLFSGRLPSSFSDMLEMVIFTVDDNMFSGALPTLRRMSHLYVMFVQSNAFTGHLNGLVNASTQLELAYIDVGNNQFSDTLPDELFQLPNLNGFTAVSNCITGSIPLSVCEPHFLSFLDLDGLTTAPACQRRFVPHSDVFTSYMLTGHVTKGIPPCLFNMSNLVTLHLSGNAIEWSFPSDLVINDMLTDLSMSHNVLTGTIPHIIQHRVWSNLDLSFNRLGGVLHVDMTSTPNTSLTLQVNRLSGYIPASLQFAPDINILAGNLFACDLERESLPVHDPNYDNYQCGSNSFNQSIAAWGVFGGIMLALFVTLVLSLVLRERRRVILDWFVRKYRTLQLWMSVFAKDSTSDTSNLQLLDITLNRMRLSLFRMTVLVLVVFMPTFIALSFHFSTLYEQYAWFLSAAYLRGQTPAIILAVLCMLFVMLLFYAQSDVHRPQVGRDALEHITASWQKRLVKYISLLVVLVVNCSVMILLNSGYVYITLTYGTNMIVLAQVVVALFKLFWNDVVVRAMIVFARRFYMSADSVQSSPIHSDVQVTRDSAARKQEENRDMAVLAFIVLFNNILAPCFANMAVSPSCFVNVIVAVGDVSSSYVDEHCTSYELDAFTFDCKTFSSETLSTSFAPPFLYNYQCSSSFITNYASVYVYMFMFVAFIKPPCVLLLGKLYAQCEPSSLLFRCLDSTVYTLLKPNRADHSHPLFFKEPFVLRIVGKISIFLTFGVMFPPLAVVICVAVFTDTYLVQLMIGYFLTSVSDEKLRHQYVLQLERDCQGVGEEQGYDSGLVILFAALFYAFFVFDIYGDAAGLRDAAILATVFLMVPMAVVGLRAAHNIWLARKVLGERSKSEQNKLSLDSPHQMTKNALHAEQEEKKGAYHLSEIRMSNMSETF